MSTELIVQNNITTLANWGELTSRAEYLAKSELIPSSLRGKPSNVAIILQIGCELGISPMQALNGVSVIQGKPGVDPQLAIALIRQRVPGAVIKFKCDESKAEVTMARSKDTLDEAYTAVWTMEKARKMQLDKKDNYVKQPGTMLRWRAVMEAARAVFPDVIKGMYSAEELSTFAPEPGAPGSADDKVNRLQSLVKPAEKVVESVVELAEQASAMPDAAAVLEPVIEQLEPAFNPLADYVITIEHPTLKGKKLSDCPRQDLETCAAKIQTAMKSGAVSGKLLETVTRIDEYLNSFESGGTTIFN